MKKWADEVAPTGFRNSLPRLVLMEPTLSSLMGLLFKQASNYSLRYMTNLQLMPSVCVVSLGLLFFPPTVSWGIGGNHRKRGKQGLI